MLFPIKEKNLATFSSCISIQVSHFYCTSICTFASTKFIHMTCTAIITLHVNYAIILMKTTISSASYLIVSSKMKKNTSGNGVKENKLAGKQEFHKDLPVSSRTRPVSSTSYYIKPLS